MTHLCRRHKCPSGRDSDMVHSARVVQRVLDGDDDRRHRRHRTARCSRPGTCTAPRSTPAYDRPTRRRRVVRPSTASRRRRKWNLNTKLHRYDQRSVWRPLSPIACPHALSLHRLVDWVKVLRLTRHKITHSGDVLYSQSLGLVLNN